MTKGCWNCHYGIRRGKLCVDCFRMLLIGSIPFWVVLLERILR